MSNSGTGCFSKKSRNRPKGNLLNEATQGGSMSDSIEANGVAGARVADETPPTSPTTLGIIGMIAWILPIVGLPVAIVGLVKALKYRAKFPGHYTLAIVLCTIALFLSIVNAGIGAYLGATGQHGVVNSMRGE
jgi:hypothetical protein